MSDPHQRTEDEWKQFRFPSTIDRSHEVAAVPVALVSAEEEEEQGDGETRQGEGDQGEGAEHVPVLASPEPELDASQWVFIPESSSLRHTGLKKQVALGELDMGYKIVRLLSIFQMREELEPASFTEALAAACRYRFDMTVEQVIATYPNGIPWNPPPAVTPKMGAGH